MVTDTLPSSSDATDVCRWVDMDCMLADALTKQTSPEKLVTAIDTNTLELRTANREYSEEARQAATESRSQRSTEGEEEAAGATTVE